MTRLIRLTGCQRAALNGTEIDGRTFVEVDLFHTQPDGTEMFMRVLLSHERAASTVSRLEAQRAAVAARLEQAKRLQPASIDATSGASQ
ncbi:Uncharacterised protein [Burkholderia pseudomallei]|uniref:hypothetical protein n=1 Tax=Burkholderia pseudomallei TaxID=28450 RepID=UPI000975BA2B|nr:hypothetical protein [Burkholderia pseudomallei]MCQ8218993.1 hypothetical protein [Burkholderia pseudomallei]ONE98014.1 hypothetical protein AQ959_13320 [Burkholderia pseudomallei]CAJ3126124.1 Uncharacterised protein [Burkholderia pseudomallei]CAJ3179568.1 Uncharacterised protein [Burkholderia pseudomallei]CAJ3393432.1 Uncharacterised protein [Burkholderia pseudomallei]